MGRQRKANFTTIVLRNSLKIMIKSCIQQIMSEHSLLLKDPLEH